MRTITTATSINNTVTINYSDGLVGKIIFLEDDIFRFYIDPTNLFEDYAKPHKESHLGRIQIRKDDSLDYSKPTVKINDESNKLLIFCNTTSVEFDKKRNTMSVKKDGHVIFEETHPIEITEDKTTQTLVHHKDEYFFGGGTQNGRFTHKGQSINIVNESNWVDGGVASPSPFYWSTKGYGVLRNTFQAGKYDFGNTDETRVQTIHHEERFDAYYFLGDTPKELLQGYYKVTGNPVLLPEYAYYLGHLNAYNRDGWSKTNEGAAKDWQLEDGEVYYEHGRNRDYKLPIDPETGKIPLDSSIIPETLNGDSPISDLPFETLYPFSARAVLDGHQKRDMPLGYFLPNDGYGAGYGQHGYYQDYPLGSNTDDEARDQAIQDNIKNLARFSQYAKDRGVTTGLWTQSGLTPEGSAHDSFGYRGYQTLRDFKNEVLKGGISAFKTDVAWVGPGYSMTLDSTKIVYEGLGVTKQRPNIISLNGWAGSQRHAAIWSGDQTGGNWEYIRFHIPTYLGQGLAGNPNVGSDIDGIFGGNSLITTRDLQWKTFTPIMLDMDGWGLRPKKPYGHSDDHDDINRMYLKLKAELMPYLYTTAYEAIDGLPMVRALFLEYPNDKKTYTKDVQYQFMYGSQFLVAPIYQNTIADEQGNDIRNNIYLPDSNQIWIDYFTGDAYQGGQTINGFDTPLWKLPLFVKNGAIIPKYEEHNNPKAITENNSMGLDKSKRIFEFYPSEALTSYTVIEDDGITMNALDENGNECANVSYGAKVETRLHSMVKDSTAILSIDKSTGSYDGYETNKQTTAIINLSQKPKRIILKVNDSVVHVEQVNSLKAFEAAKENNETIYFYEETPNLNKYAQGGGDFEAKEIITNPKLHIAIASSNAQENAVEIQIEDFVYDYKLGEYQLNASLETPIFGEYETSATSITLNWNQIEGATSYEIESDGEMHGGFKGNVTQFIHDELSYITKMNYKIRSRNKDGFSAWSDVITISTDLDPWRNVPNSKVTTTIPEFHYTYGLENAFNRLLTPAQFISVPNEDNQLVGKDIILEFDEIHELADLTYHVFENYKDRFMSQMDISTSFDGVHWTQIYDGPSKTFTQEDFVVNVDDHPEIKIDLASAKGKYLKITAKQVNGNNISISEMIVNKVEGSRSYPLGDFNLDGKIDAEDLTQIHNYKGLTAASHQFTTQVLENNADVNKNGVFDIYDYSFVLNQMDGGNNKEGQPEGTINYESSHERIVSAGDVFTIKLTGTELKNVNALGTIFNYDSNDFEIISIDAIGDIKNMEDISVKDGGEGNNKVATISFGNRGDKAMLSGNHDLVEIKIKSLKDNSVIYPEEFMLIGPKSELLELTVIKTTIGH